MRSRGAWRRGISAAGAGWGRRVLVVCVAAIVASGCANHVRFLDVQKDDHFSERTDRRVVFRAPDGELVRNPRVHLDVYALDRFVDSHHRTLHRYEESTPYEGTREFLEVPVGLFSVPFSLAFHMARVALFFYIPGEPVVAYTNYTFASLNPGLNVEDADRVVRVEIELEDTEPERVEREERTPLRHRTVHARLDEAEPVALRTDAEGVLSFHLLDLVANGAGAYPRKIVLTIESPEASGQMTEHELFVERGLAQRVGQSRRFVAARESGSVGTLSEVVYAVDRLGFEAYSLRLEDEIAREYREDPTFLLNFHQALRGLYDANAPLPELRSALEADLSGTNPTEAPGPQ